MAGRYRRRLAQEQHAAAVYRALAAKRAGEDREILLALARAEERHAAHWSAKLQPEAPAAGQPGWRTRLFGWLARRLGSLVVLGLVQRAEAAGDYDADADATPAMAADERVHALVVAELAQRQRARASGWFRAAVFGANDGLVSNFSLVAGMAGAAPPPRSSCSPAWPGCSRGRYPWPPGSTSRCAPSGSCWTPPPTSSTRPLATLRDHEAHELALVFRARGCPGGGRAAGRGPARPARRPAGKPGAGGW